MSAVATDTGPFAIVPEWLLDLDVSDRAIRLYAVLARYADAEGACFPSRETLALRLDCSRDSVDRATRELLDADAIEKSPRYTESGDNTSNLYVVYRTPPGRTAAPTWPELAPVGGRGPAAQNENHEQDPVNESALTRKRRTSIPSPEWQPSEQTKDWCRREYPEHAKIGVLEAFRDHHIAKGSKFIDWERAFKQWIRYQEQFDTARQRRFT